jgi:hypothetical protein
VQGAENVLPESHDLDHVLAAHWRQLDQGVSCILFGGVVTVLGQAFCDMSVTPARTLIMKMGGNSMCFGSGIWTSGVEHNGAAFVAANV